MHKTTKTAELKFLQILKEDGSCNDALAPHLTENEITQMYKDMVFARTLDNKMLNLQRQGKIATFAQVKGQEAAQVASAHAIAKQDWIVPAFREIAVSLVRGVPAENLLIYNGGREEGSVTPQGTNMFPTSIPVGTHMLHAVGFAWGKMLQEKNIVVLTYFGDGATSEGDFHEAMNFAMVCNVPVIFICQNNQFAISTTVKKQTKAETLAQKAFAYEMPTVQVDGNDVFAVYKATADAVANARKGKGPAFIECVTYRLADHTTADDARRYRSDDEVKQWEKKDPILRLKTFMENNQLWDNAKEQAMVAQIENKIKKAQEIFENLPKAQLKDMFQFTFKDMPKELQEQQQEMIQSAEQCSEDELWYH